MATIKQYLRKWSVMINGEPFIDERDGHQFRCVFDIEVKPGGSAMIAEIQIYNLSRKDIIEQRSDISFSAGYADNFGVLFDGTVTNIVRERRGPDIVTRLFCRSSMAATRGIMYGAYGPGANVIDVLRDAAKAWPLYLDIDPSQFSEKDVFPAGWTADPDIPTTLDKLKNMFGFLWTVSRGSLVITRLNEERSTTIFDINQFSGMVGSPELIGVGSGVGVEVTTKINPLIQASSRINVKSEFTSYQTGSLHIAEMEVDASASGLFNVFKINYLGDTHGSAWDMRIQGFRAGSETPLSMDTGGGLVWGRVVEPEFRAKVREIAGELGIDPNWLMAVMAFETGETFNPAEKNKAGSGATGLIQFMPSTARDLGTTTAELAAMTRLQQLKYVKAYFEPYKSRIKNIGDAYMAVFMPAKGIGKSDNFILIDRDTSPTTYRQNSSLDKNDDGKITRGEAVERVNKAYIKGKMHMA